MSEKMTLDGIDKMLAKIRPLREPDSLLMTEGMRDKIAEALKPMLVAKAESPGYRYAGMEIRCHPAGTVVYNKKTGERAVIHENTVISAISEDVVIVEAGRALLAAAGGRDDK